MAYEQPHYTVELDQKPFQIRDYAPYIVAEVHVGGTRDAAIGEGFRILAGYIFGGNTKKSSIAMTTPVTQSASETIPMTTPVTQKESSDGWDVRFAMPSAYTTETLPKPNDGRVHFVQIPARRVAVIVFSGFYSESNLGEHRQQLLDFVKQRRLTAAGPAAYAFYDPPWTPWFWRTNEVQVEVAR